ncbi:TPA: hypothetical protein U1C22_000966 [Streptococcus suis]|nr:hypothetical protein [Streptococcus suis]
MKKNFSEEIEKKIDKKMRQEATKKTIVAVLLSFSGLLLYIIWNLLSMKVDVVLYGIKEFFIIKLSLFTVSISNLASMISNIYDIDGFWTKTSDIIKKRFRIKKSHNYPIYKANLLLVLILIAYCSSIDNSSIVHVCLSFLFYVFNVLLIYKINLMKEQDNRDKYEDYQVEMQKEWDKMRSGKDLQSINNGVKL